MTDDQVLDVFTTPGKPCCHSKLDALETELRSPLLVSGPGMVERGIALIARARKILDARGQTRDPRFK